MAIHLRRAGAAEPQVRQVLDAVNQWNGDRRRITTVYMKGGGTWDTFRKQMEERGKVYHQQLVSILDEKRYRAFVALYTAEISLIAPAPGTTGRVGGQQLLGTLR